MSESLKTIIFVCCVSLAIFLLTHVRKFLRSFRLSSFAMGNKFSFSRNYKFFYPDARRFNQIKIQKNGKDIEIFDSCRFRWLPGISYGIESYGTIMIVNGNTELETKNSFLSIRKIKAKLRSIGVIE